MLIFLSWATKLLQYMDISQSQWDMDSTQPTQKCRWGTHRPFIDHLAPTHTHTYTSVLRRFFRDHLGWAGARRELLDFMEQGKINKGRHTDHPAGRYFIRTKQCPSPPSPIFTGRMPFLPPNQQCQSTEGNQHILIREKTLEFSSTVLSAPSPYLVHRLTTT